MKQYFKMIQYVLDNGIKTHNRTGIDTIAVSGYMFKHDMRTGFPLLTSKKMGLKNIGTELEFFLHGLTSKKWLQDRKCYIWNQWANPQKVLYGHDEETLKKLAEEDDLGKIYGYQWINYESPQKIIEVPIKTRNKEYKKEISCISDTSIVETFKSIYGEDIFNKVRTIWFGCLNGMLQVETLWYDLSTFLIDIQQLINWPAFVREPEKYILDVSYYKADYISKDTCIWLSKKENLLYTFSKTFYCTDKNGNKEVYFSIEECGLNYNLDTKDIEKCLSGEIQEVNGYTFKFTEKNYRYQQSINQIQKLVNTIKTNPTDRRMIVIGWNPTQLDEMALPPCHYCFQVLCYPETKEIDLIFNMRSVDLGLGFPYDIASYGLLLSLLAKETGYIPRYLTAFLGNTHIYENQIEKLKEQLQRPLHSLPSIDFKKWNGIWRWESTDTIINNYVSEGPLKMEVAI